jgi:hypothetical protein
VSADGSVQTRTGFWSALLTLAASSGTLVCCALPALLVALGAGAALASLVGAFPQLVWLSEHKEALFSVAALLLAGSGVLHWRNRHAPCPADARLRAACMRTRRLSARIWLASVAITLVGGWFAFVQPLLAA